MVSSETNYKLNGQVSIYHLKMTRPSYNTPLYRLIQLVSIVCIFTLPPGYARKVRHTATPELRLEVGSKNLTGSNRTIRLTITNTSTAVADLTKCSLVTFERDGKPVEIYYQNRAGTIEKMFYPAVPLTELIDTEILNVPGASQTCTIFLAPNGYSNATLTLSVEDGRGKDESELAGPTSVTWRKDKSLLDQWTDASLFVGITALCFSSAILIGKGIAYAGAPGGQPKVPKVDDLSNPSVIQENFADASSNRPKLPLGSGLSIAEGKDKFVQKLEKLLNKEIWGQASIMPNLASDAYQYYSEEEPQKRNNTNTLIIGPVDIAEDLVKALCKTLEVACLSISATKISPSTLNTSNTQLAPILMITNMDCCNPSPEAKDCIRRSLLPFLRNKNIWVICLGTFNFDEDQPTNGACYPQQPLRELPREQLIDTLRKDYGIQKLFLDEFSGILHLNPYVWPGEPQKIEKKGKIWGRWNLAKPFWEAVRDYYEPSSVPDQEEISSSSSERESKESDNSPCSGQDTNQELHLRTGDSDETSSERENLACSVQEASPNVSTSQKV